MNSKIKRISDIIDRKEYRVFSESCDLVYLNNSRLIPAGESGFIEKFKKFFKTIWAKIKALIKYLILKFKRNKSIDERITFSKMKIDRIKNKLDMAYYTEYENFTIDVPERVTRLSGGIHSPIIKSADNFFHLLKRSISALTDKSGRVFELMKEMFTDDPNELRNITFDAFLLGDFSGHRSPTLKGKSSIYKYKDTLDAELDKKKYGKNGLPLFLRNFKAGSS